MTEFGVTPAGFVRPRLEDVRQVLRDAFVETYGPINLDEDDVVGQLIGIEAKVIADLWEALEESYLAKYRSSAEGVSLDRAVEAIGVVRNSSTRTTAVAALFGIENAVVPAQARASTALGVEYVLSEPVTISRSDLLVGDIQVTQAVDGLSLIHI